VLHVHSDVIFEYMREYQRNIALSPSKRMH
jgi:hypothetical protein